MCCPPGQEFIYNVNNFPLICQVKKRQVCLKAENLSKFVPSFYTTFLSPWSLLPQCPPHTSHFGTTYGGGEQSRDPGRNIYTINNTNQNYHKNAFQNFTITHHDSSQKASMAWCGVWLLETLSGIYHCKVRKIRIIFLFLSETQLYIAFISPLDDATFS